MVKGGQRKKRETVSVFLNMSKAPGLIRLSHGATGGHLFCLALFRLLHSPAAEKIHSQA